MNRDFYEKDFVSSHTEALTLFQWLEEGLREYISVAYKVLSLASVHVPFRYSEKDLENDSLGRLIEKYSKIAPDVGLVARLHPLVKDRNHIAHKAFVHGWKSREDSEVLTLRLEGLVKTMRPAIEVTQTIFIQLKTIKKTLEDMKK